MKKTHTLLLPMLSPIHQSGLVDVASVSYTHLDVYKRQGYRNREIASIFITYATVASLTGALLGLAVGYYLFPKIIFDAYGQMYNIPDLVTPWYLN